MRPIEIACNHLGCDAQPGEGCIWTYGSPFTGSRVRKQSPTNFHSQRIEDAAAMATGAGEPTKEDFNKAVDESGLV